ncbi:hypothetical protein HYS93_05040 [Candidatus Daviesbacteria bacterium]|nr:hypothetical protein [Candidatus Daviesbacteria bacterium]
MKGFKTAYVFVMVTLLSLTIALAVAAFYPAPKRYSYPEYPRTSSLDFNSPTYKAEQEKYQRDLEEYNQKNKKTEEQRRIWGQNTFNIALGSGLVLMILGLLLFRFAPMLSVSLLFAAFIVVLFGPGLMSYYAENTSLPLFGSKSDVDLTGYKQIQFGISFAGVLIGSVLGFTNFTMDKQQSV